MNLNDLLVLPIKNIEKMMENECPQMKLYEIDALIKELESYKIRLEREENEEPLNEKEVESHQKIKLISERVNFYRKNTSEEHYKKYKKELPANLEKFMDANFPEAPNLHIITSIAGDENIYSPMGLAIRKNNRQVIKELLAMDTLESFTRDRSEETGIINAFITDYLPEQYTIEDFKWWIETVYQLPDKYSNSILKGILSEFFSGQTPLPNKVRLECLSFLAENPKYIDFFRAEEFEEDPSVKNIVSGVINFKTATSDFNLLLPFVEKFDFNKSSDDQIARFIEYASSLFTIYAKLEQEIERESKPNFMYMKTGTESNEEREARLERRKNASTVMNSLKLFIPKVLSKIPSQHQKGLEELFVKDDAFLKSAIRDNDPEMLMYALEYGSKITPDLTRYILENANEKTLEILARYHNKTMTNFANELFDMVMSFEKLPRYQRPGKDELDQRDYSFEAHLNLAKLPIDWDDKRSDAFMKRIFNYNEECRIGLIEQSKINKLKATQADSYFSYLSRTGKIEAKPKKSILSEIEVKTEKDVAMTDSLFGHVLNDHALAGTTLQGSQISKSMRFINKLISKIKDGSWTIPGLDQTQMKYTLENLNQIQTSFNQGLEITDMVEKIGVHIAKNEKTKSEYTPESIIDELVNHFYIQIKKEPKVLLPGGWTGLNFTTGHAMLYEIVKTDKGYVLLIHNTGAGIEHHKRYESENGSYFSSVKAYSIPTDNLEEFEDDLKILLKTLFRPQIEPCFGQKGFDANTIYANIEKTANAIGMREISPEPYNHEWTQGQMSGTCAWQVMGSYLKNQNFDNRGLQYPDIRHEVMKFAIDEYSKDNRQRLASGTVQRQLHFGLQSFSRNVRALSEREPHLTEARRNSALDLIQSTKTALQNAKPKSATSSTEELPQYISDARLETKSKEVEQKSSLEASLQTANTHYKTTFFRAAPSSLTSNATLDSKLPNYTLIKFDPEDPLKSLNQALALCKSNYQSGHPAAVDRMLGQYFLSIPIGSDLWNKLSDKDLAQSIDTLQELNAIQARCMASQSLIPLPEQNITLCTGSVISLDIAKSLFKNNPAARSQMLYKCSGENMNFNRLLESPYFVTANPQLNKRAQEIANYLRATRADAGQNYDPEKSFVEFVIGNSDSRQKLLAECNSDRFFTHRDVADENIKLVAYYLEKRASLKSRYPDIEQNIKTAYQLYRMSTEVGLSANGMIDAVLEVPIGKNVMEMAVTEPLKKAKPSINSETGKWQIKLNQGENFSKDYQSKMQRDIRSSQAPIADPLLRTCIEGERLSSNQIQALTEGTLTEQAALKRSILGTRVDADAQVSATLDLIKKEYYRFNEIPFQNFAFLNLFQGNLLDKQLFETPSFAIDMLDLIEKGLKTYTQKGRIRQPALAFYKMAVFLENTVKLLPENVKNEMHETALKGLKEIGRTLESSIHYYENILSTKMDPHAVHLQRELHELNLIRLQDESDLTLKSCQSILAAIAFRKNYPHSDSDDPFIAHAANVATENLKPKLKQAMEKLQTESPTDFQILLNGFVTKTGVTMPKRDDVEWSGKYPNYKLMLKNSSNVLVNMNVIQGIIYQNNVQTIPTPPEVYNNPIFTSLFREKPPFCQVSPDQSTYEFEIKGNKYRLNLKKDLRDPTSKPLGTLQRTFTINGQTQWFQYESPGANTFPVMGLPHTMTEYGKKFWVSVGASSERNQQIVITDEVTGNFVCSIENGRVLGLDAAGNHTRTQLISVENNDALFHAYPFLKEYESDSFIELWKKNAADGKMEEMIIKLPRYGVEFRSLKKLDGSFGDLLLMPDKKYKVKPRTHEIIPNFSQPLILEEVDNPKNNLAVVPIQQFVATERHQAEFHALEFDTRGILLKHNMLGDVFKQADLEKQGVIRYTESEKLATFKVNPTSTTLEAESTDDKIYLAYLHLANREPLLAYELLQKVINENKPLTAEQLEGLRRIMLEVPAKIATDAEGKKIENEATMNSPEVLSVRLLVGTLLANQKLQNNIPSILSLGKRTMDSVSESQREYESNSSKNLSSALEDKKLTETLLRIYNDLHRKRKKIPDQMRPKTNEERSLLRYISKHQDKLPAHVVNKRKLLALSRYLEERTRLEKLKKEQVEKFTKQLQKRLERVNAKICTFTEVDTNQTVIVGEKVNLYPDASIAFQFPSHRFLFEENNSKLAAEKVSVKNLSAATLDLDFLYSFQDFYKIAKGSSSGERDLLLKKLDKTLDGIAAKRQASQQTLSARDNLSILLYSVLKNPNDFPQPPLSVEKLNQSLSGLVKLKSEAPGTDRLVSVRKIVHLKASIKTPVVRPVERNMKIDTSTITAPKIAFGTERERFNEIVEKRRRSEHKEQKEMAELITIRETDEPVRKSLYQEVLTDYVEGAAKNISLLDRNESAVELWNSLTRETSDGVPPVLDKVQQAVNNSQRELDRIQGLILSLVQTPPEDPILRADWELRKTALDRHDLTMPELMHLFLMQDVHLYQEKTGLSVENVHKLNQMIFEYLIRATDLQHHERILKEMNKLKDKNLSPDQYQAICSQIALLLDIERSFNPAEHPEMLLFEYLDNKIIYKEQFTYLKDFIEQENGLFKSQAVQLIMGGGKSKVLTPLLALKKATGTNLPIIEVPHALFQLNKADLQLMTKEKFGKDAHAFFFDDAVDCTQEYLANRLKEFRNIIVNKEYLITTKESMQSLELKFIRMLRFLDENDPEAVNKVKLMGEMLRIFKYQGDVVIDEVDSTLDTRKQLITSVGKGLEVPKHESEAVYDLYDFMKTLKISIGPKETDVIPLQQVILGERACSDAEWKLIFEQLAERLVKNPESPLAVMMSKMLKDTKIASEVEVIQQNLINYLLGRSQEIPAEIKNLSDIEQDCIAIYKEELSSTLGLTLRRNLQEHYGLPLDRNKGVLSEIAIPFAASNTPNEKSKFSNYLETIGYTLQAHSRKPISKEIVKTVIQHFKMLEEQEMRPPTKLQEGAKLSPAEEFHALTGKSLDDIDVESNESVEDFYNFVKENQKFRRYCLLEYVLNHVEKSSIYLSSDAQNHASQFRTVQGMTGTNWNKRTFPVYMVPNDLVSKGSDGQTINHLLRNPQQTHLLPETGNKPAKILSEALNLLSSHANKKSLHAWIDLGAYFKGLGNMEVAKEFSQYFARSPDFQYQKFVLYFGQDDKLYAMPVSSDPNKLIPIKLDNTDPDYIQRVLGCSPDNYFTYYDQRRTTGTDINQATEAHALVTLGVKTLSRDYLQAVARMRGLKNAQRIECVIPKDVQDAHPEITHWDVNSVIKFCIDNQVDRLAEDHFRSSLQKLKNVVRNDLFEKLLGEHDVKKQKALMNKFHKVFFNEIRRTAFQQFGGVKKLEKTKDVLDKTKDDLLKQWKSIMSEASMPVSEMDSKAVLDYMTAIIDQSLPICYKEIYRLKSLEEANVDDRLSSLDEANLQDAEMTEEKVEEEENVEEEEQEQENEATLRKEAVPLKIKRLKRINFEGFTIDPKIRFGGLQVSSMNDMLKQGEPGTEKSEKGARPFTFSDNLFVSQNYLKTIEAQSEAMDGYKKDGVFFMVEQDDIKGTIKFMVITPEEAAQLRSQLSTRALSDTHHFWIETDHQTPQGGRKPAKLHPDYHKGIEQMAFLSGDLDVLYQQLNKNSWLREDTPKKLTFLRDTIKPIHRDKADLFRPLVQKASQEFGMDNLTSTLLPSFQKKRSGDRETKSQLEEQPIQESGLVGLRRDS